MLVDTATQILDLHSQFLTKVGDINRHYMGMLRASPTPAGWRCCLTYCPGSGRNFPWWSSPCLRAIPLSWRRSFPMAGWI
jgi:hypothetical protein